MRKIIIYFLLSLMMCSCIKVANSDSLNISAIIQEEQCTKVSINGLSFSFDEGEQLSLIAEGVNSSTISNSQTGNLNVFSGTITRKNITKNDCSWYAVYPNKICVSSNGVISASVPTTQIAPFDNNAETMFSNIIIADYNESNLPTFSFSLSQTTGLVQITIKNNDPTYADEVIKSIKFSSSSSILSGDYTINLHQTNPSPSFNDNGRSLVISQYQSSEILGTNIDHTVSLFVNPVTVNDAVITVVTDKHIFIKEAANTFTITQGGLTRFGALDLNSFDVRALPTDSKRVACWGDSFTHYLDVSYTNYLIPLLGSRWTVLDGGIAGDRVEEIAARQGGLSIVTDEEFVMPASGSVRVGGVLRTRDKACNEGYFHIRHYGSGERLANPCLINGIECRVYSSSSYPTGKDIDDPSASFFAYITRIGSGDPVTIPSHTPIITYGARFAKDVDLQIIYMGTNGVVQYNGVLGDDNYYDNLVNYHRYMTNFNTYKRDYLILGYHLGTFNKYYWERFCQEFGESRMINLHDIIPQRGRELMVRTGAYPDYASIPDSELYRIDTGQWPECFFYSSTDHHPSEYGAHAMAIVIYERMQELGYID